MSTYVSATEEVKGIFRKLGEATKEGLPWSGIVYGGLIDAYMAGMERGREIYVEELKKEPLNPPKEYLDAIPQDPR